jgi:hypothetical protein
MAHYATINEQNQVIAVNTGVDEDVTQLDENDNEVGGSSEAWENFYTEQLANPNLKVKRCSYNGNIRSKYPAIGDLYNEELDIFESVEIKNES